MPHPAQRLGLDHDDVGGAGSPHRERVLGPPDGLVGGHRHIDPAPQLGQLVQGGTGLLGVLEAEPVQLTQGAFGLADVPGGVGVDPDLPAGPSASLTASTRATSSARDWPRSATLTLAVRHPDAATSACACAGPTAGTVTFTGTWSRTGGGQPTVAASTAQASQRAHSLGP